MVKPSLPKTVSPNTPVAGMKAYKGRVTAQGKPVVQFKGKNYQIPQQGVSRSLNAQRLANARRMAERRRWDAQRRHAVKNRLAALAAGTAVAATATKASALDGGDLVTLGALGHGSGGGSGTIGGDGAGGGNNSGGSGTGGEKRGLTEEFNQASAAGNTRRGAAATTEKLILPNSLGAAASPIRTASRIQNSPYATRLAQNLSQAAQRDVDNLVAQLKAGNANPGIGTRALGNGFFELRGANSGRVIIKQKSAGEYDIVGKFQGHVRGDSANSTTIKRLVSDYEKMEN
jgi:hypothetical protein